MTNQQEGFAQHVANEQRVRQEVEKRRIQHIKKLEEALRQREKVIKLAKQEQELLEKYDEELRLISYLDYLRHVVESFDGSEQEVKGTRIVQRRTGEEDVGHKVERMLFGRPYIRKRQRILTLRNPSDTDAKDAVFDDLVTYYGNELFQRGVYREDAHGKEKEECLLGRFIYSALKEMLVRQGLKDPTIHMYSAVMTPLDFHFGVDAWVEISDETCPEPIRVFIDLKTDNANKNKSENSYADIIMTVETRNGEVNLESRQNVQLLMRSVLEIVQVLMQKKRERCSKM